MTPRLAVMSLGKAIDRLAEALGEPETALVRDACIQRFEFAFELAWKAIQRSAAEEDMVCNSPRECLRAAFRLGWIDNDAGWMRMIDDRNRTAHTYDEQLAVEIYQRLPGHLGLFRGLHGVLMNHLPERP
jgi:nucleotidyltransferase substrate binding protein (TIGR01987 family)